MSASGSLVWKLAQRSIAQHRRRTAARSFGGCGALAASADAV
jgi:hypothetical protein